MLSVRIMQHDVRVSVAAVASAAEPIFDLPGVSSATSLIEFTTQVRRLCQVLFALISASGIGGDPLAVLRSELRSKGGEMRLLAEHMEDLASAGSDPSVQTRVAAVCEAVKRLCLVVDSDISMEPITGTGSSASAIRGCSILIVDDDYDNRRVLSRRVLRDGGEPLLAETGHQALRMLQQYPVDLILLDIMMPDLDGISVLSRLKATAIFHHLPVIMITAVDDLDNVVHCIELGADDYLCKPFNPTVLRARMNALLERKKLRDEEERKNEQLRVMLQEIQEQREKTENLLRNILPEIVAQELQLHGCVSPVYFGDVTVVFADIVGFTASTEDLAADELVSILNEYFTAFDKIVFQYGLEKLKTIGDCYMFAGGLPTRSVSHPVDCVFAALELRDCSAKLAVSGPVNWKLRIGINTGPVIAGVVGIHKFAFDIWGEAVNMSSRMESSGLADHIQLSASTYARVKDFFNCDKRVGVRLKDGREVDTYVLSGMSHRFVSTDSVRAREVLASRYQAYFGAELRSCPAFLFEAGQLL